MAPQETPVESSSARRAPLLAVATLGLLYLIAVLVYRVLAHQSPIPLLIPDEITYGTLARSVADGHGLVFRGTPVDLRSPLYVYLIAPAWKGASGSGAFDAAQTIGAATLPLTIVPVWLLARRYVGQWLALIPALLVVSGTWMLTTAGLFTENLALPLCAGALSATVLAISRPGSRWAWAALGLAVLGALARSQLVILIPVIVLALAADCARCGHAWRTRLRKHRLLAGVSAALVLAGALAVLVAPGTLGIYEHPQGTLTAGGLLGALKDELTALIAMSPVLPVVVLAAASAGTRNWRDERVGPLLAVSWSAVVLFLAQSAWALNKLDVNVDRWEIQRYIEYPLPLLLVTMTVLVADRRVGARALAIAGAAVALILLESPAVRLVQEERGLYAIYERMNALISSSAGLSFAIVALVLVATAILAITRGRTASIRLAAVGAAMLVVLLVQSQASWHWQRTTTHALAVGDPARQSWVDDAGAGSVARMLIVSNAQRAELTQFLNDDIDRVYVPGQQLAGAPVNSRSCSWAPDASGNVQWDAACGAAPRHVLLDDEFAKVGFYDQRIVAVNPAVGHVVELPERARLRYLLRVPCTPAVAVVQSGGHGAIIPPTRACFPALQGGFWLDRPATLLLQFRGGGGEAHVSFDNGLRVETLAPRVGTTIRVPISTGASGFSAALDWAQAGLDFPELTSARLVEPGRRPLSLLY